MRPLKFRAWKKEGEHMVRSPQAVSTILFREIRNWKSGGLDGQGGDYPNGKVERGDYEIMQSTGIFDRNGKEIYEGDIVRKHFRTFIGEESKRDFLVEWSGEEACYKEPSFRENDGWWNMSKDKEASYEVLGNIHENPELEYGSR